MMIGTWVIEIGESELIGRFSETDDFSEFGTVLYV